jgi:TRAP-type C4-dicarboxylate transport system substrate-binding protein
MPCRLSGGGTVIAPERAAQGSAPANGRAITDKNTEYERLKMGHLRTSATAVAVAALLASAVSPAGAAALKWDMASPYPGSNFHNQNHRMFIEEVKSRTNGAIDITLHPGASLYKLPQIRKAVQTGQIAIGEQLMATLENQAPIFGIDSLPFVANDIEKARLLAGLSANAVKKELDKSDLVLLYAVAWPGQSLFTRKPIASVEDLKGMKMRVQSPASARLAELLGSIPVRVESADVAQAMTTGIVEAFMTSPSSGYDWKSWDYSTHYYELSAWQPKNVVYIGKSMFKKLTAEQQAILMDAAAKAEIRGWYLMQEEVKVKQAKLCEKLKCENPASAKLVEGFLKIGKQMTDEWVEKTGGDAKSVVDAFRAVNTVAKAD